MNFSDMWQTWLKAATGPNDATFTELRQKPDATITTAIIWMAIYGAVAAIVGVLSAVMFAGAMQGIWPTLISQMDLPPQEAAQIQQIMRFFGSNMIVGAGFSSLGNIVLIPLMFLIGVGIYHLLAKLFGGTGEYGRLAYLSAAFSAPLGILSVLLSLAPLVNCVTPLITLYSLVLTYFALKIEHQLTSGRAILVILIPILVVLLLFACLLFGIISMIISLQNN